MGTRSALWALCLVLCVGTCMGMVRMRITQSPDSAVDSENAVLSGDGSALAFVSNFDWHNGNRLSGFEVWMYNVDGNVTQTYNSTRITHASGDFVTVNHTRPADFVRIGPPLAPYVEDLGTLVNVTECVDRRDTLSDGVCSVVVNSTYCELDDTGTLKTPVLCEFVNTTFCEPLYRLGNASLGEFCESLNSTLCAPDALHASLLDGDDNWCELIFDVYCSDQACLTQDGYFDANHTCVLPGVLPCNVTRVVGGFLECLDNRTGLNLTLAGAPPAGNASDADARFFCDGLADERFCKLLTYDYVSTHLPLYVPPPAVNCTGPLCNTTCNPCTFDCSLVNVTTSGACVIDEVLAAVEHENLCDVWNTTFCASNVTCETFGVYVKDFVNTTSDPLDESRGFAPSMDYHGHRLVYGRRDGLYLWERRFAHDGATNATVQVGTNLTLISALPTRHAVINGNGSTIAFVSEYDVTRNATHLADTDALRLNTTELFLYHVASGTFERVTNGTAYYDADGVPQTLGSDHPTLDSNATYVLFESHADLDGSLPRREYGRARNLWAYSIRDSIWGDAGTMTRLTYGDMRNNATFAASGVRLFPDETALFFEVEGALVLEAPSDVTRVAGSRRNVYKLELPGGIPSLHIAADADDGTVGPAMVSRSGKTLVWHGSSEQWPDQLYRRHAVSGVVERLTKYRVEERGIRRARAPSVSARGDLLAFHSDGEYAYLGGVSDDSSEIYLFSLPYVLRATVAPASGYVRIGDLIEVTVVATEDELRIDPATCHLNHIPITRVLEPGGHRYILHYEAQEDEGDWAEGELHVTCNLEDREGYGAEIVAFSNANTLIGDLTRPVISTVEITPSEGIVSVDDVMVLSMAVSEPVARDGACLLNGLPVNTFDFIGHIAVTDTYLYEATYVLADGDPVWDEGELAVHCPLEDAANYDVVATTFTGDSASVGATINPEVLAAYVVSVDPMPAGNITNVGTTLVVNMHARANDYRFYPQLVIGPAGCRINHVDVRDSLVWDYALELYNVTYVMRDGDTDWTHGALAIDCQFEHATTGNKARTTALTQPFELAGDSNIPFAASVTLLPVGVRWARVGTALTVAIDAKEDGLFLSPTGCRVNGHERELVPVGDGRYEVYYTVAEGDADWGAGALPLHCELQDRANNRRLLTRFTDNNAARGDGHSPHIFDAYLTPRTGIGIVGDELHLHLFTDDANLIPGNAGCRINHVALSTLRAVESATPQPGVYEYLGVYTVGEGDFDDFEPGELPLACQLRDTAGNTDAIATFSNTTLLTLDAQSPRVLHTAIMQPPPGVDVVRVGDQVEVLLMTDHDDLRVGPLGCALNGVDVASTFVAVRDDTTVFNYTVRFTVDRNQPDWQPGALPLHCELLDVNGNHAVLNAPPDPARELEGDSIPLVSSTNVFPEDGLLRIGEQVRVLLVVGEDGLFVSERITLDDAFALPLASGGESGYEETIGDIDDSAAVDLVQRAARRTTGTTGTAGTAGTAGTPARTPAMLRNDNDGCGFVNSSCVINCRPVGESFQPQGEGRYFLYYTIGEGDDDVSERTLRVRCLLEDAAGNLVLTNRITNDLGLIIDANTPTVYNVSASPHAGSVDRGDETVTVTFDMHENGLLSHESGCFVNQVNVMDSWRSNGDGTYSVEYVPGDEDLAWRPGKLSVFCFIQDAAGNLARATRFTDGNSLAMAESFASRFNLDLLLGTVIPGGVLFFAMLWLAKRWVVRRAAEVKKLSEEMKTANYNLIWDVKPEEIRDPNDVLHDYGDIGQVRRMVWRKKNVLVHMTYRGRFDKSDTTDVLAFKESVEEVRRLRDEGLLWVMGGFILQCDRMMMCEYPSMETTLYQWLREYWDEFRLNHDLRMRIAHRIAHVVKFLHDHSTLHYSLTSHNVYMESLPDEDDVELKVLFCGEIQRWESQHDSAKGWFPPELRRGLPFSPRANTYSFGILLWELITGEEPTKGKNLPEWESLVCYEEYRPPIPMWCPDDYKRLIEACWAPEPLDRPVMDEVLVMLDEMIADYRSGKTRQVVLSRDELEEDEAALTVQQVNKRALQHSLASAPMWAPRAEVEDGAGAGSDGIELTDVLDTAASYSFRGAGEYTPDHLVRERKMAFVQSYDPKTGGYTPIFGTKAPASLRDVSVRERASEEQRARERRAHEMKQRELLDQYDNTRNMLGLTSNRKPWEEDEGERDRKVSLHFTKRPSGVRMIGGGLEESHPSRRRGGGVRGTQRRAHSGRFEVGAYDDGGPSYSMGPGEWDDGPEYAEEENYEAW